VNEPIEQIETAERGPRSNRHRAGRPGGIIVKDRLRPSFADYRLPKRRLSKLLRRSDRSPPRADRRRHRRLTVRRPRGRGSGDLACCAPQFLSLAGWSRRSPNGPQSPDVRCAVHGVRSCSGTGVPSALRTASSRPRRLSLLRRTFGRCGPRLTGETSTPRKDLAPIRQDSIKNSAAGRSTSHRRVWSRPDRFFREGVGVKARDMMSFVRVAVEVNDFVDTATAAMGRSRVSAAPVLDDTGRLVGLVTASHLTLAWLDAELHPVRTFFPPIWRRSCPTVGAVMSSPAVSLTPGADLSQVTDMFRD